MKALGSPLNPTEARAEQAIAALGVDELNGVTYTAATAPVASPSYSAVESVSFLVASGTGAVRFLRIASDEVADFVDGETAARAAQRCGDMGLAPRLLGYAPAQRAMLFEYLGDGWRSARIDDLMHDASVARLVALQKDIAAGAPFGRSWSVFDGINSSWLALAQTSVPIPVDIDWMRDWMVAMRAAIEASGIDRKPAHGDPHSSNVMIGPDNAIKLVDFDMAGDMDPYYQLGAQMNELYQFESQMKPLLEMHDGAYSEAAFSRCRIYAAADDLYWALRSLVLVARSPLPGVEFLKYAA